MKIEILVVLLFMLSTKQHKQAFRVSKNVLRPRLKSGQLVESSCVVTVVMGNQVDCFVPFLSLLLKLCGIL